MKGDSFTIERRVPLGFIAALLLQAATAVWWAAGKDAQDMSRDRRLGAIEQQQQHTQNYEVQVIERLARLEAQGENTNALLRQLMASKAGSRP